MQVLVLNAWPESSLSKFHDFLYCVEHACQGNTVLSLIRTVQMVKSSEIIAQRDNVARDASVAYILILTTFRLPKHCVSKPDNGEPLFSFRDY